MIINEDISIRFNSVDLHRFSKDHRIFAWIYRRSLGEGDSWGHRPVSLSGYRFLPFWNLTWMWDITICRKIIHMLLYVYPRETMFPVTPRLQYVGPKTWNQEPYGSYSKGLGKWLNIHGLRRCSLLNHGDVLCKVFFNWKRDILF